MGKPVQPSPKGRKAQAAYWKRIGHLEQRWEARFGKNTMRDLRASLRPLVGVPLPDPYPHGWRASVPKPQTLPHFPMVLHRGWFPDGG